MKKCDKLNKKQLKELNNLVAVGSGKEVCRLQAILMLNNDGEFRRVYR